MQPIYEFGGSGQVINLALANGFPPATYIPLMQPFTKDYRVVCMLPRALWGSGEQPPELLVDGWEMFARDLVTGLREHDLRDVIAIGHSFGGIVSICAALTEIERFKALILLDPTIFTHEFIQAFTTMRSNGTIHEFPLVSRAMRRQRTFASAEEAYQYFRSRPLFADWSDEAVRLYAEKGTIPSGNGVTLAWSPEWEAYYYKIAYVGIWNDLPSLPGKLPILIVRGATSDTYLPESAEKVKQLLPEATHVEIAGHGHLFPQSAPGETYRVIRGWLSTL
jgi:pimeloyl-ACP methyl ester carboxylesterase